MLLLIVFKAILIKVNYANGPGHPFISVTMTQNLAILFWLQRSKLNKRGKCPIYIRITVDGGRAGIASGKWIEPERWNPNSGRVRGNSEEAKAINEFLRKSWAKITSQFDKFTEHEKLVTATLMKKAFLGKLEQKKPLVELFENHNKRLETLVGNQYASGTYKRYKVSLNHLKSFLEKQYNISDISLTELDFKFITDYEYYLHNDKGCGTNAALKHIQNLRKIVNNAVDNDWLAKDPFSRFKRAREQTKRGFLTESELEKIYDKGIDIARVAQVRDIFVFACYTGLSYSDVAKLTPDNIVKGIDGHDWISIDRTKTDEKSSIPLMDPALKTINKYKNHPEANNKGLVFPVISNQKTNLYLKELAEICGIKKRLSFHLARHTFATTVTLNNHVSIESVSKMLGHKSIKTTEIYAKILDTRVAEDMKKVKDKFNSEVCTEGSETAIPVPTNRN